MDNVNVFDLYFASVVAMQYHPGAGRGEAVKLSLEECAEVALRMLVVRDELLKE